MAARICLSHRMKTRYIFLLLSSFLESKGHEVKSMDRKRAKQFQTIALALIVTAVLCIILSNFFFTLGTIQHIILSFIIIVLSVSAYFIRRLSKSNDM